MIDVLNVYGNLGTKLCKARKYVRKRYDYYNDEQNGKKLYEGEVSGSPSSDAIKETIDNLQNKLLVSHFVNADTIKHLFTKNVLNKLIKSFLISGCSFVRIIHEGKKIKELIPYDAYYATGKLKNDNTLSAGISIDDTDDYGNPTVIVEYDEEKTTTYDRNKKKVIPKYHDTNIVPLIPIIANQNSMKPFGCSYITKKMMSDTDRLIKKKRQSDVVDETLTNANTFLNGVSKTIKKDLDNNELEKIKNVVLITKDADGQHPTLESRDAGASSLDEKIDKLEANIKYDTTSEAYADMVASIRQDLIDGINRVGDAIIKITSGDSNATLDGKIDIVFKNNDFSNFSPFMDGVLKVNQVIPGYLGKEQLDQILGINGNKPPLMQRIEGTQDDDELQDVKGAGQKMYGTTSILKNYTAKSITEKTALKMLELIGWTSEEAQQLIDDEDMRK